MKTPMTKLLALLILSLMAILPVAAQDEMAMLRVAHFSPDAPAVDVYVNGDVAVANLSFSAVTPFLELAADTYEVAVAPAGTSIDDAVIGPVELTLEAASATTVAAVGSVDAGTLTATVIEEDYSPIDAGSTRITVVHAIENESAIDIYGSSILLVQALRYPEGSGDGAFTRDVPVGRYNFEANIAETDTTIRVANGVELAEGEYYLIAALGPQANEGEMLVVTPEGYSPDEEMSAEDMLVDAGDDDMADDSDDMSEDSDDDMADDSDDMSEDSDDDMSDDDDMVMMLEEGSAMLRVAHFSPDAPAVDVYINGELAVAGLEFPEVTAFMGLAGGDYEVVVAAADTSLDDAVIDPVSLTLEEDSNTTVAAVGSLDRDTLEITVFEEDFSELASGTVQITAVHAIEGESALDIIGSSILLIQALNYPDLDAGRDGAFTREVPAGRYNFEANVAESAATVRVANGVELEGGQHYLIVALGPQSNEGELLIVTPDGYENPDEE